MNRITQALLLLLLPLAGLFAGRGFAAADTEAIPWNAEMDRLPSGTSVEFAQDIPVPKNVRGLIFKDGQIVMSTAQASITKVPASLGDFCYLFVRDAAEEDRRIGGGADGKPRMLQAPAADFLGSEYQVPPNPVTLRRHYVDFPFMRPAAPSLVSIGCVEVSASDLKDAREAKKGEKADGPRPVRVLENTLTTHFGPYLKRHLFKAPPEKAQIEQVAQSSKAPTPAQQVKCVASQKSCEPIQVDKLQPVQDLLKDLKNSATK